MSTFDNVSGHSNSISYTPGLVGQLREQAMPEPPRRYSLAQVPKLSSCGSRQDSQDFDGPIRGGRHALMAEHLYRQCQTAGWFSDADFTNIVAVRSSVGAAGTSTYTTYPPAEQVDGIEVLLNGLAILNCESALIMGGHLVSSLLSGLGEDMRIAALADDVHLEIVDTLEELATVKRHQYATFIYSHTALVTWAVDVTSLIPNTQRICGLMLQFLWRVPPLAERSDTKAENLIETTPSADLESYTTLPRPICLISPLHVGLACGINILVCCNTISTLIREFYLDRSWLRLLIIIVIPLQACVSQFFCVIVVAVILQFLGPVAQMHENSRYYSGKRPPRMKAPLPPFTILMPVYKEGLESVLQPTINSLQKAIQTYELQGGSVNILVCDDGMQLLNEEDFATRKAFYDANTIAYVARPKHSKHYQRAGRFKKASNLNIALELTIRVEVLMHELRPRSSSSASWSFGDEEQLYERCLHTALSETVKRSRADENGVQPEEFRVWAAGNIRIGEFILIIDSDTRVPEDCFLDAASEMHLSPECAIIQHASDVMFVANHFFENGIAFFTRLVNTSISWVSSNGDVGCFVGHNAFIRWSALQEIAAMQPDGRWQIWSESHVSEDFDCALRMLVAGYDVRWASYSNGGFQEGVSLTAVDEINRWQKYAFGVSELLFYPIKHWLSKGPFTPMARFFFIESNLPIHYKFSALAYMLSYYGISVAFPLTILNYILYGLFIPSLDNVYLPSWQVNVALFVVFGCASALGFAILRYRCGEADLARALWEQAKWTPFNTVFFMGLSFHVGLALIAHLVGYNMTWSSTVKEADESATVFTELPAIFSRFQLLFTVCLLCILMIFLFNFVYTSHQQWNITDWVSIFPLALLVTGHVLYAFVLNPTVMGLRF